MTDLRPAARAWVDLVVLAALGTTLLVAHSVPEARGDWTAFALLLVCAAVAHVFPIRPAFDNVTYHLTGAFLVAGALVLSPVQMAVLAAASLAPDLWLRRRVPSMRVMWAFNAAQTTIATLLAFVWLEWTHAHQLETIGDAGALLIAVGMFALVQAVLVGAVVALTARKSLMRSGTFSRAALLSDVAIGLGGLLVAGLWTVKPLLLLGVPALLFVLHRATRTAHLAQLAERDPKTGLYNARFLDRVLEDSVSRGTRAGQSVAVLFADLDHFKRVNDRHGHEAGDLVLRGVADILQSQVGRAGVVARYGGEEFVVVVPGRAQEQAADLAERIRYAVEHQRFELPSGGILSCTISIGVAVAPTDASDAHALLDAADTALRDAKRSRNSVAHCTRTVDTRPTSAAARESRPVPQASPRSALVMLWATVAAGALGAASSLITVAQRPELWTELIPFIAIAVFAEFMSVSVYEARQERISLSFSIAAIMAAVGAEPLAAPLVSLAASLVAVVVVMGQRQRSKLLFNVANPVLASTVASALYALVRPSDHEISASNLAAGLVAVAVYVGINVGLISIMIGLHSGRSLRSVVLESSWFAPTNVLLGLTGAFVGGAFAQLGPIVVGMFVIPILLMRYTLAFYAHRSRRTIRTLEHQAATLEEQADQLERLALHDALTDLPNRLALERQLDHILTDSNHVPGLVLLDLKRFTQINDTFGHQNGDHLLKEVGPRLQGIQHEHGMIARLGGDEFAIVLPRISEVPEQIVCAIQAALSEPFVIEGYSVEVDASIGIATADEATREAQALLRQADVALDVAKRSQEGHATYRAEFDGNSPERVTLVGELRYAIEHDGLTLAYQPQDGCARGGGIRAEALVRWNHPVRGPIPPDDFVALAERTGLIRPLTRWVIDRALQQCHVWRELGHAVPIAVNVSMHDLHDVALPDEISAALAKWDIPADHVCVEVTEGTLMTDPRRALEVLGRLRSLGVQIAVDDFGIGYSSLAYLGRLPVSELKIDRSFVSTMCADVSNAAIVRSTINLGHDLGLSVVAEGVEDEETWRMLRRLGCDSVQGYWISRPLSPFAFGEWLQSRSHGTQAAAA
jgi:diguanylate cyclase (GGDEF)-like protein